MPLRQKPAFVGKKKGVTFRMHAEAKARLERLCRHYNVTITEAMHTLIDDAYEKAFPEDCQKPLTFEQLVKREDLNRRYPDA
jgi:antitoxin component of RelBE/YafQ-DinJ toxin-antitoxin module